MIDSLIKKYKLMPHAARASFWAIVSSIMLKGVGFFTLPIFTRLLTTSEYGVLAIYYSWTSLVSILITFTVWGGVFNVGMVKYPNRAQFISGIQGLSVTSVSLFFLLSIIFLEPFSRLLDMSPFLICCMFMEILTSVPYYIWIGVETYDFRYKSKLLLSIGLGLLNPILGYFAVINLPWHAEARIVAGIIPGIFVGIYFFCKQQWGGKLFFDGKLWKYVLGFNAVLILHYLSMAVLNQSDRIMINSLCDSSKAGIYNVAYNFAVLLNIISGGITASLTPYVYRCMKNNSTDKLAYINNLAAILVGGCALMLICIVPDVFQFMLPPDYYEAMWIIPPITLGAYFMFLYPMFGAIEFYFEVNHYVTIASFGGAILNIILNALFIPVFGYMAAAYTTLVCYLCFALCHYYFMKRILKQKNCTAKIYDGIAITKISIILSVISFIVLYLYDMPVYRWLFFSIIAILMLYKRQYFIANIKMIRQNKS